MATPAGRRRGILGWLARIAAAVTFGLTMRAGSWIAVRSCSSRAFVRTTPVARLESLRPARADLTSGRSLRRTSFASLRFWSKAAAKDRFQAESVAW